MMFETYNNMLNYIIECGKIHKWVDHTSLGYRSGGPRVVSFELLDGTIIEFK